MNINKQYEAQTRHYNALTKKGWHIVRAHGSYWLVTKGQSAWNGFATWSDALHACEAMAAADAVVVH